MRLTAGAPWQSGRGQLLRVWGWEPRGRGYGDVRAWLPGAVGNLRGVAVGVLGRGFKVQRGPRGCGYGVQGRGCKVRRGPKGPGYGGAEGYQRGVSMGTAQRTAGGFQVGPSGAWLQDWGGSRRSMTMGVEGNRRNKGTECKRGTAGVAIRCRGEPQGPDGGGDHRGAAVTPRVTSGSQLLW